MQFFAKTLTCALLGIGLAGQAFAQGHPNVHNPKIVNPGGVNGSTTTKGGGTGLQNPSIKQASDKIQEEKAAKGELPPPSTSSLALTAYAQTITPNDLQAHLTFLASEELEGRETATRGQKVAARYLASQFQKMGLQPGNKGSWYQTYELNRVEIKDVKASLDGGKKYLSKGKEFIFFNKVALSESFEAPLVFAGFGIAADNYDNLRDVDVRNKTAVILHGEPVRDEKFVISGGNAPSEWGGNVNRKANALKQAGAKAVVIVFSNADFDAMAGKSFVQHAMSGSSLSLADKKQGSSIPLIIVPERVMEAYFKKAGHSADGLRKSLSGSEKVPAVAFKKAKLKVDSDAVKEVVTAENVLGFLEGTDKKDEVIVLTAHYDHLGVHDGKVYYGADDDGTGTAAILEIAEAFAQAAKAGHRPRRSILFMPVSGEEKGLLGSEYYTDHPVYPIANTVCNLNIDMIGRLDEAHEKDSLYVYVIGSDKLSSDLHRANEMANQTVTQLDLDYTFNAPDDPNRFYYRSDHYNFARYGVPVIFYFSGVHPDYHKPTDTIDKILFGKTATITQLVFATAWEVANKEERLKVDRKNDFEEK